METKAYMMEYLEDKVCSKEAYFSGIVVIPFDQHSSASLRSVRQCGKLIEGRNANNKSANEGRVPHRCNTWEDIKCGLSVLSDGQESF